MSRARTYYALAVLFAINMMNFFDRQIWARVGEAIRKEWALSDTALGTARHRVHLLYAVVGLPLGRLADGFSRTRSWRVGVFVWSLLTAASGACTQLRAAVRRCASASASAKRRARRPLRR